MVESKRDTTIDLLRGFAMLAMILIHTTVFYVSNPVAFFLWNFSQWAVPMFIFCSGYLYFQKTQNVVVPFMARKGAINRSTTNIFNYFKKRFLRLLIPYYVFLPFYLFFTWIISPKVLSSNYMWQSIFLIGGVPINWLVLLFLQFAILLPVISWMLFKHKILFWIYLFLAVGSSVVFLFWKPPFDWKYIMWLPWSTVLIFSLFVIKESFLKISFLLSFIIYLLSLAIVYLLGHSTHFYDNKYPPNLLIISFGIAVISLFYVVVPFMARKGAINRSTTDLLVFLSKYSYSIYFIHYLVLLLLSQLVDRLKSMWFLLFFLVFISAILIQKLLLLILIKIKHLCMR